MQIYTNMAPLELGGKEGSAVALGYFDGIHVGHQTVIGGAVSWAKAHGAAAALFTFKLPGASKIKGRRLFSIEDKRRIVAGLGVEHYLVPAFADIQAMTPEQFVYGLVADCQARAFFCGENFTFGAKAAGDPTLLRALCAPADSLIYLAELDYMKEAPVTAVWLDKYKLYSSFLQWNHEFGHRDLIRSLSARMSDEDRATEAGQEITAYLNLPETVGVGDDMVDGDLYDLDGNIRHLAEFKGKYILLDFWSQGCGPCVKSLPEMEEITAQYKDRMEVVSISQDPKDSWKEFIARKGLKGNQWNELRMGNTGLAAAYGVTGIPHYVMISPDGRILDIWAGYARNYLKSKVKALVK